MIQKQSVRNRLRNQLNVQLTDSNVIGTKDGEMMESKIQPNEFDSISDISIIHELGMLDSFYQTSWKNDTKDYIHNRNQTILYDNLHNYTDEQRYLQKKVSPFSPLRSKLKSLRQDLQSQEERPNENRIFQRKIRGGQVKTPPRNLFHMQSSKHVLKSQKEHNQIADIESKISILPYQLQQKIKENLHKKISPLSIEQHKDSSLIKYNEIFIPQFHKSISGEQCILKNANMYLISPEEDQGYGNYTNRQKFVSVNREPLNSPKNINMSLIVKDNSWMKLHKQISSHLNFNNKKIERSIQRQNLIWNSIQPKQSPSLLLNKRSKSRDRQQSITKNRQNVKKTAQIIETRKNQFEQYYNNQSVNKGNDKELISKVSMQEISEQFNESKVIKFFSEILNSLPKCKKCSTSYGALTLWDNTVGFSCNQCDLKNKEERSVSFLSSISSEEPVLGINNRLQKQQVHFNHPVIGALFDIQNKLTNQTQMKTYNSLIKEITLELQKIQQLKKKLTQLHCTVQELKSKVRTNPKSIFEAKNALKKIFTSDFTSNDCPNHYHQQQKLQFIDKLIPPSYLQELDLWCKLKAQNYTQWPSIDQKLQILCPLYMKKNIKTIKQFLDPLLHNFQNNDIKISVSQGLKLPVKSLGSATFIVDGSYNISAFDHIQRLSMEFINKRTFRQITSMMQNLPQIVQQLKVSYNHKLNSHISAQKYPILTKICSIRSAKKLRATILNCKDEEDLISAMKVMTKKKQLSITTTRSIYVRKPLTEATKEIKQMIKRLDKKIHRCELNLAVVFNEHKIHRELILTQRNKLMNFELKSTLLNQFEGEFRNDKHEDDNFMGECSVINGVSQADLSRMNDSQWLLNEPKRLFLQKMRKKLSVLAVLKDSFKQKELIQKYRNNQNVIVQNLTKKHKLNHNLRLQILKMIL